MWIKKIFIIINNFRQLLFAYSHGIKRTIEARLVVCQNSSHQITQDEWAKKKFLFTYQFNSKGGRILNVLCNSLSHIGNSSILISVNSKYWFRFPICWLMLTFESMWSTKHQFTKICWSKKKWNKKIAHSCMRLTLNTEKYTCQ